jgi:hypothetical protein
LEDLNQEQQNTGKNNIQQEQTCKILHGVYRDGDDFENDIITENDGELMRIFPPITEPEHTKILLDIYGRKKHLDEVNKQINKIASLNHDLIK